MTFSFIGKIKKFWKQILLGVLGIGVASAYFVGAPTETSLRVPFNQILEYKERGSEVRYSWKGAEFNVSGKNMTENGWWVKNEDGTITKRVYVGRQFIPESGKWFIREYATTTKAEFNRAKPLSRKLIDYVYADSVFATEDGRLINFQASGDSWANIRDNGTVFSDGSGELTADTHTSTDTYNDIDRIGFCFDTNVGGGTALTAQLNAKTNSCCSPSAGWVDFGVNIASFTPADPTAFVAGDYDLANHGGTVLSTDRAISSLSADTYYTWDYNDVSSIDLNSYSCIALRYDADIENSEPAWSSNVSSQVIFDTVEETGTTDDPFLVFTYSAGGASEEEPIFDNFIYWPLYDLKVALWYGVSDFIGTAYAKTWR